MELGQIKRSPLDTGKLNESIEECKENIRKSTEALEHLKKTPTKLKGTAQSPYKKGRMNCIKNEIGDLMSKIDQAQKNIYKVNSQREHSGVRRQQQEAIYE